MPLPNPSANPVGKRRGIKLKKYIAYITLTLILFIFPGTAYAESDVDSDLFKEEEKVVQVFNYGDESLRITDKDVDLMAQVVYAESSSEPFEGKIGVASVIINRLRHPQFPKTVDGVIRQSGAFSCLKDGKIDVVPDESSYEAVKEALNGNDPTSKALFFYNPKIATSKWMFDIPKENVKSIGNHVFFSVNK
jgi:N-acetylmuramoyl-L-alanine amidase